MVTFIDISSYQAPLNLVAAKSTPIQGVVIKATQGTNYVNPYCDTHYEQAKSCGMLRGFYHYADSGSPECEAEYFWNNCRNYFRDGIPVLDWEENQSVDWVNRFVRHLKDISGVWCWIYANPSRFNQGAVESNCARWIADYPSVVHPTFSQASNWDCPTANGNVVAWQFCSDGRVNGYDKDVDCSIYYGDEESWRKYAGCSNASSSNGVGSTVGNSNDLLAEPVTITGDGIKVTIEKA